MNASLLAPTTILSILIALTVHEWAHAFTAWKLGDDTARWAGRLTLNPLAHLDLMGALMFVLVGFGWAKPVPVDPRNFRHPVRDNALVAVAGPFSNLVLAFCAALLLVFIGSFENTGHPVFMVALAILQSSLVVNLALMAFNLLPIPPLDGGNIARMFVPWRYRDRYEEFVRYGPWILLAVLLAESFLNVPILSAWVGGISDAVLRVFSLVL